MSKQNEEYKNLDKRQQDCLALIESLGIYELRALARVFGDNSPTTLKRSDHIKIIMDKIVSGEELRPLPLRQGRPYKELSNIDGILSKLSAVSGKDYKNSSNFGFNTSTAPNTISFHQAKEDVLKQRLMPVDARGVLKEKSISELYFQNLENGTMVLVKKSLDPRLRPNDYVTGSAILMNDEGDFALESVKTINFQSDKLYVENLHQLETVSANETFNFGAQKILLGGRYVFNFAKFVDEETKLKDILKKLTEENIVTLALIPNVLDEEKEQLENLGFVAPFFIKYDAKPQNASETILSFIDCVSRLQNQGLNLAVFVEDIVTLANLLDLNDKVSSARSETSLETIKRMMLLPKAYKSGSSTTLFTTQDETDLLDKTYLSCVYKISKKISL